MGIIIDGTTGIDLGHTPVSNGTNYEVEGNLNLSGVGARITGDFSNATINNRTMFQSGVPNGNTAISLIPNGTSTIALHQYNTTPDITNSSTFKVGVDGTICIINSSKNGTGTYLPIVISTVNTERMRIDTSGNVLVTGSGVLGYGTGSGGTVTQLTSKSTSVTLNKPSGQITMNNAALAAGASVDFILNNTSILTYSIVYVNPVWSSAIYKTEVLLNTTGAVIIRVTNTDSISHTDSLIVRFTVIAGANS